MSTPSITVFTQPGCPTCTQVKSYLKARGLVFDERDVRADDAALQELQHRGYAATPLTLVDGQEILGVNRAKFEQALGSRQARVEA